MAWYGTVRLRDCATAFKEMKMESRYMSEARAMYSLKDCVQPDGSLHDESRYLYWDGIGDHVELNGVFTTENLEALLWWMRNRGSANDNGAASRIWSLFLSAPKMSRTEWEEIFKGIMSDTGIK